MERTSGTCDAPRSAVVAPVTTRTWDDGGEAMANWQSYSSFLGNHWTYVQENSDSCGPSCVMMMIRKRTNMVIDEKDAFLAYDSYGNDAEYDNPDGEVIREYDGSVYTNADRLARTIRTLIGNAKDHWTDVNKVGKRIKAALRNGPLIGLVTWRPGGGHFVMIDAGGKNAKGQFLASVCDPWDGAMRLIPIADSGPIDYMPKYPATRKAQGKRPGGAQSGYFNGWLVF
jgi:hypothetical protein